jgi:hypothetical protein
MEGTQLRYAIKFVAAMDKAVKFHRDVLGLGVKFESPGWSEFATGETTLSLHPASDKNPAGKIELGFTVADVEAFYLDISAKGVLSPCFPRSRISAGCWRSLSLPRAHIAVSAWRRRSSRSGGAVRQIAEFIAVLACALFTGASVYITFIEHPGRMEYGV